MILLYLQLLYVALVFDRSKQDKTSTTMRTFIRDHQSSRSLSQVMSGLPVNLQIAVKGPPPQLAEHLLHSLQLPQTQSEEHSATLQSMASWEHQQLSVVSDVSVINCLVFTCKPWSRMPAKSQQISQNWCDDKGPVLGYTS